MHKTLVFLSATLFLAACGGSADTVACAVQYADDEVSTCIPTGWRTVDRSQLDERGIPAEVVVAFQSDTPVAGQFSTVTVTRETLARTMNTQEYSEASIASVAALPGYEEVDKRSVTIEGADIDMHIFNAQPRDDQPLSRFYQVSAVAPDNTGYTVTGATPVAVSDELEAQVALILRSVTFVADDAADDEEAVEE